MVRIFACALPAGKPAFSGIGRLLSGQQGFATRFAFQVVVFRNAHTQRSPTLRLGGAQDDGLWTGSLLFDDAHADPIRQLATAAR
jgi:hypothetical protein